MKLILIVLLGILSYQAYALATSDAEEVASSVVQYGMQRFRGMRLMRAGGGQQCYEKYIPQISVIADRGANETKECNNRAASRKQDELAKVEIQRAEISRQVEAVLDSLKKCSANTDVLEFLRCLKTDASTNLNYVKQSAQDAADVFGKIEGSIANIESSENTCIAGVIARAKKDTDELFADLQRCLINGFDDPQPETSTETSTEPSTEASTEASTEPGTEPSTESSTKTTLVTSTEPGTEPSTESSTEPSTETTAAPQNDDDFNPNLYPEADI